MVRIKKYLYKDKNNLYHINIGVRIHSRDKDFIFKVYDEMASVDFKPSLVNKILLKRKRELHKYDIKMKPYYVRKWRDMEKYTLYILGWYIKTSNNRDEILSLLDEYLESEDKEEWLDSHYRPSQHGTTGEKYIYRVPRTGKYRATGYNSEYAKSVYYGEYDTLEEAVRVRDRMQERGFPIPPRRRKPYRSNKKSPEMKYIHYCNNRYHVQKQGEHYGTFKDLESAQQERDWLVENQWSYENIDLY